MCDFVALGAALGLSEEKKNAAHYDPEEVVELTIRSGFALVLYGPISLGIALTATR